MTIIIIVMVSLEDSTLITTYDRGKYSDDIRSCCYELLSLNVGIRNIKPVIKTVLKNIAHKGVD